jgi:hypothetical protein
MTKATIVQIFDMTNGLSNFVCKTLKVQLLFLTDLPVPTGIYYTYFVRFLFCRISVKIHHNGRFDMQKRMRMLRSNLRIWIIKICATY